jgi:curved DNA-binding protein CbpA
MPRVHTHYDNLKVARNAPAEIIRAAYRTLSKKYHPDHNPDNKEAIRIIQLINAAYEVLSDPVKRAEHDKWIARMEAEDAPKRNDWSHASGPSASRQQARSRRDMPTRAHRSHHASVTAQRLIHKMQIMLGQFSRYLSKKA